MDGLERINFPDVINTQKFAPFAAKPIADPKSGVARLFFRYPLIVSMK